METCAWFLDCQRDHFITYYGLSPQKQLYCGEKISFGNGTIVALYAENTGLPNITVKILLLYLNI